MSDIVERLRRTLSDLPGNDDDLFNEIHAQRDEAAEEIERLRAENKQQAERIKHLERHVDVLQDKIPDDACACGYDEPGDICAIHWAEQAALAKQENK
jgi:predicted nuclease with TOPRIM domain